LNILLVIRWPVGGIRTFIRYVYQNFDQGLYSITIVAPDLPEMEVLTADLAGLSVRYVKVSADPSIIELTMAIARLVFSNYYDIIHSHGFTSAMCAALPAFAKRVPHILTSHDVLNNKQFKGTRGLLRKIGMGLMLATINTIHSVSYDAHENLCKYFPFLGHNSKCIVIQNGIEVKRFVNAEPRNLREELELAEDAFLVAFFGRFMSQKGFRYLVEAMEKIVGEVPLTKNPIVVAFGEGGYIREEKAGIKKKGLEGCFRFLPFTSNVASSIKGVDVVVMPSLWEACPLLPMETLVCGVPLIGTNCIGLREILQGTPAVVVEPGDGVALSIAIEAEILQSSKAIFESFKDQAMDRFNVNNTSDLIKKLYANSIIT
jgi:glycosyltransferase involved in cell wall biosynthesis